MTWNKPRRWDSATKCTTTRQRREWYPDVTVMDAKTLAAAYLSFWDAWSMTHDLRAVKEHVFPTAHGMLGIYSGGSTAGYRLLGEAIAVGNALVYWADHRKEERLPFQVALAVTKHKTVL